MRIPNKLKIGGHIVKVNIKDLEVNGESIYHTGEINLDKDAGQTQKEATLIHEIFHMINTTLTGNQVGHALVDSLAEQFYQVLSDNKLLK